MDRKLTAATVRHLPLTKFRQSVGDVVNRVHRTKEYVIIERGGLPLAAVMDIDEFEDYLELRDSAAQRDIDQSRRDIRAGRIRPAEDLLAELKAAAARGPHLASSRK